MKIILSRKGFDSSNGGMASPIFPDGSIISLPILAQDSPTTLSELKADTRNIDDVVSSLSKNRIAPQQRVHLDPDIDTRLLADRPAGWKGAFGQAGAAQKHLANMGVGKGDLFIFFGWFRGVEQCDGVWRFRRNARDLHIIYGWLWVEEVLSVSRREEEVLGKFPWLAKHPHLHGMNDVQNTLYVGSSNLPSELAANKPGYGVFETVRDIQILTDTNQDKRSVWKLPSSFYPDNKPPLSYHTKMDRWASHDDGWVTLNSVARGQEFVLDTAHYPGVAGWLATLFAKP